MHFFFACISIKSPARGINSVGRVPVLHAGCQEFESPILHHFEKKEPLRALFSCPDLILRVRVIRHLKLKCLTHKMINFKINDFKGRIYKTKCPTF